MLGSTDEGGFGPVVPHRYDGCVSTPGITPRERTEQIEHEILSPRAVFADATKGRDRDEPQDDMRTVFQRDRDRIVHSKAFRRLKHKTQVFLAPEGDHYRVRLTHTLDVSQIARTAARALRLNEDLTEAIALGHDLGHTPFGHLGEQALTPVPRPAVPAQRAERCASSSTSRTTARGSTSPGRSATASCTTRGPCRAVHARGAGRAVRRPHRLRQPRHRRRRARRRARRRRAARPVPSLRSGHTHSQRIDTLVRDLVTPERRPATEIRLSPPSSARSTPCATSCSPRSTCARAPGSDHEKAVKLIRDLFRLLPGAPRRAARPSTIGPRATCRPASPTTSRA